MIFGVVWYLLVFTGIRWCFFVPFLLHLVFGVKGEVVPTDTLP